tara:strand:- start:9755 stop:13246 length:3492 start_codon:yes stop_codon:yes gene_type:complete
MEPQQDSYRRPPTRSPKKCFLALAVSFLGLITALTVMVGWKIESATIVQIVPGWAPMQASTAIGFLFYSAALLLISTNGKWSNSWAAVTLSTAVLLWGTINLSQHLLQIDLGIDRLLGVPFLTDRSPAPGRMSLLTSFLFVVSGTALLVSILGRSMKLCGLLGIVLAAFLCGLSGSLIFTYIADIPPVIWLGKRYSEVAIHTSIGFFALSLGFISHQFYCGLAAKTGKTSWIWIPVFCSTFFAVITIYMGLATEAQENRTNLASERAKAFSNLLSARTHEMITALYRMADRVGSIEGYQREDWIPDAENYLHDFKSLRLLNVRNQSGSIDWSFSEETTAVQEWFRDRPKEWSPRERFTFINIPQEVSPNKINLILFERDPENPNSQEICLSTVIDWKELAVENLLEENPADTADLSIFMGNPSELPLSQYDHFITSISPISESLFWIVAIDTNSLHQQTRLQKFFLAGGVCISLLLSFFVHSLQLGRARVKEIEKSRWESARQQAILESFVTHAPAAVAMFDKEMRYIAASLAWTKDYQIQGTEIIGRCHYEVFPNISDEWKEIHRRALQGHVESCNRDRWRPEGWDHDQYLRWEVRPWKEPDGTIGGIMLFTSDVTEDVEREMEVIAMQEKAEEANRLKSEFLANMSHEIRTPMNGVIGMTSILQETPLEPDQQDCVEVIRDSTDALLNIIDDILDFSKIEAARIELETEQFNLNELIATTVEMLSPIAARRKNEIISWVELESPVDLIGDSGRLRQVITNLVGNAIKFTENGDIVILIKPVEQTKTRFFLSFEIKDTGMGMSPEQCQKIFEPFVQADGSTARKFGGTGLGLSISQRLVEAMGGTLVVSSELGKGTVFSFTVDFPVASPNNQSENKYPALDLLEGKRCLLLLFSKQATEMVAAQLKTWHIEVEVAQSLEDAKRKIQFRAFDMIMIDSGLSAEDPLSIVRRLPLNSPVSDKHPKVIFLKPVGLALRQEDLQTAGVDQLLKKPISPSRIYDALANLAGAPTIQKYDTSQGEDSELNDARSFAGLRVLVAEDNAINRKVITMQLENLGIAVDTVSDGQEAIEAWQKFHYRIIFMDCQMPELDGYEATRRIRAATKSATELGTTAPPNPYIIALTANALKGDREQCIKAGMDDYVSKPAQNAVLRTVMRKWKDSQQ